MTKVKELAKAIRAVTSESTPDLLFYFVAFDGSDTDTLVVIDLMCTVDYQRSDWNTIDQQNFQNRDAAILYAREIAKANGLKYKPFVSRYNKEDSEPLLSVDIHTLRLNTEVH